MPTTFGGICFAAILSFEFIEKTESGCKGMMGYG
jgi:hypothetical protein